MNATDTDYRCEECGWHLLVEKPSEVAVLRDCPSCGKGRAFVREFTAEERVLLLAMLTEWKARQRKP